ncbi:MAG: hypothetical protein IPP73_20130 [Chitinophagaceae bacterium]|nr:hypothetical protein [Chitinophagaceae bacterium]
MFRGQITADKCTGDYKVYVATGNKMLTSVGSWSTQDKVAEKEILAYSIVLGKDLLISDPKPIALRIHFKLNEGYRDQFSIKMITVGPRNPEPGRYAPEVDISDNFYVYTDETGLFVKPQSSAKEANFDFQYASYGTRQYLSLPKNFTAKMHVTLKCLNGEADREEVLLIPVQITALCNVLVQKCGYGECPTLNNKKLNKLEKGSAVSGDELVIPLTMRAGRFTSEQSWKNSDNAISVEAFATKGLEAAGEKLSDKALQSGLQMLVIKGSSVSTPGVILQLTQFLGAGVAGGEPVAVRIRSKLDIMFYANGTYRIRNLEGSPEVRRKQSKPLPIPVGKEVMVSRNGIVSDPVTIGTTIIQPIVPDKVIPLYLNGEWQTKWGKMIVIQNGNKITATYEHDKGKITGTITGNTLTGTWSEAPTYLAPKDAGEFKFTFSADGRAFTGLWRYGNTGEWQTGWDGHK